MHQIPDNKYAKVNEASPAPGKNGLDEILNVYDERVAAIFADYVFRAPQIGETFVSSLSIPDDIKVLKATEYDGNDRKRFIVPPNRVVGKNGQYILIPSYETASNPKGPVGSVLYGETDDELLERLLSKMGIESILFALGSSFVRVSVRRGDTFHITAQQLLGLKGRIGRRFNKEALATGGGK